MNTKEKLEAQLAQNKKDVERLLEEQESIKEQLETINLHIPVNIFIGQVYKIKYDSYEHNYMISFNGKTKTLAIVGKSAGCWNEITFHSEVSSYDEMRKYLVQNKAEYLGDFNSLYILKDKSNGN